MPIDLPALGLILTFLMGGLSGFLRTEFSDVDPKDTLASLGLQAERLKSNLKSMVLQEIDDDILRSTLPLQKEIIIQREEYLVTKRQYVALEVTNRVWKQATKFQEIKDVYKSWNLTYIHGRLTATICIAIYLFLFAFLAILVLTKAIPDNIQNVYYWIGFIIIILPSAYILIRLLVANNLKNKFKILCEGFDEFNES